MMETEFPPLRPVAPIPLVDGIAGGGSEFVGSALPRKECAMSYLKATYGKRTKLEMPLVDFSDPIPELHPVSQDEGYSITIDEELTSKLAAPFSKVLRGHFRGFRKAIEVIHNWILQLLLPTECFHVATVDAHEVLIRFSSQVAFLQIYTLNCIMVDGVPMRLHRWTPSLRSVVDPKVVATWVAFPKLPLHLQHLVILRSIVTPWGKFLDVNRDTLFMTRPGWMRVCVEINCMAGVPSFFVIENGSDTITQPIVLEHLPRYCTKCGGWGHFNLHCRGLTRGNKQRSAGTQNRKPSPLLTKEKTVSKFMEDAPSPPLAQVEPSPLEQTPLLEHMKNTGPILRHLDPPPSPHNVPTGSAQENHPISNEEASERYSASNGCVRTTVNDVEDPKSPKAMGELSTLNRFGVLGNLPPDPSQSVHAMITRSKVRMSDIPFSGVSADWHRIDTDDEEEAVAHLRNTFSIDPPTYSSDSELGTKASPSPLDDFFIPVRRKSQKKQGKSYRLMKRLDCGSP